MHRHLCAQGFGIMLPAFKPHLLRWCQEADVDKNGVLDYEEFASLVLQVRQSDRQTAHTASECHSELMYVFIRFWSVGRLTRTRAASHPTKHCTKPCGSKPPARAPREPSPLCIDIVIVRVWYVSG